MWQLFWTPAILLDITRAWESMPDLVTGQISTNLSWLTEDPIYFPERYVWNSQDNRFITYWHYLKWRDRLLVELNISLLCALSKHIRKTTISFVMPVLLFACLSVLLVRPTKDLKLNSLDTYSIPCEWGKVYSGQTGKLFTPDSRNTNAISNRTKRRRRPRLSKQH
jgi:hypothetical protein